MDTADKIHPEPQKGDATLKPKRYRENQYDAENSSHAGREGELPRTSYYSR